MVGYDSNGNILKFDEDGNILDGGDKYDEAYLLSVARLLNKDEMKKGSFYLQLDFAVTEPGQRLYTDPGSPPAWPVAENPTLSFKDFAAKTSCPAGFFEYNAAANASATITITSDPLATQFNDGNDTFSLGGSVSPTIAYRFTSTLSAPGGAAANAVEVQIGANAAETLTNLALAINGTGTEGTNYTYSVGAGGDTGPSADIQAAWDGVSALVITSITPGGAGELIIIAIACAGGGGDAQGTVANDTASDPFDCAVGTDGIVNLELAADSVINSDDYRRISMIITDEGAQNDYRVNSPAGDYGILKIKEYKIEKWDAATNTISDVCVFDASELQAFADANPTANKVGTYDQKVGLVYYQAGVVAITPYVFAALDAGSDSAGSNDPAYLPPNPPSTKWVDPASAYLAGAKGKFLDGALFTASSAGVVFSNPACPEAGELEAAGFFPGVAAGPAQLVSGGSLGTLDVSGTWQEAPIDSSTGDDSNATGFRRRMVRMAFNNTTELNSSIYFARLNNNEFNYSANPTYLNESKIRVKETTLDAPVSYITTVGLYSADNELLAQAKLSEPVRKEIIDFYFISRTFSKPPYHLLVEVASL
jgi:hypothetical protein